MSNNVIPFLCSCVSMEAVVRCSAKLWQIFWIRVFQLETRVDHAIASQAGNCDIEFAHVKKE